MLSPSPLSCTIYNGLALNKRNVKWRRRDGWCTHWNSHGLTFYNERNTERKENIESEMKRKQNKTKQNSNRRWERTEEKEEEEEESTTAVIYHLAFYFPFTRTLFLFYSFFPFVISCSFLVVSFAVYSMFQQHFRSSSSRCQCLFCFLMLTYAHHTKTNCQIWFIVEEQERKRRSEMEQQANRIKLSRESILFLVFPCWSVFLFLSFVTFCCVEF